MKTGVAEEHLPDLIAEFLPLSNEVAGFASGEYRGAMLMEQRDDGEGIGQLGARLTRSYGLEGTRDAIEFRFDLEDNLLGPFDLIGSSRDIICNSLRWTYGRGRAGFGNGGLLWNVRMSL